MIVCGGCGTSKWSDTTRTGTEQLLISNAIDNAVGKIDFTPLENKKAFIDTEAIEQVTDSHYLSKALRHHLAASGGILCDQEEDSDYIVEVRAGAVGTDRDDMLVGIPALTFPSIPGTEFSAGTIPEIPFIKRTRQKGIAKVAVFTYNRHTGRPVFASGNQYSESSAKNLWVAGTGPITKGSIYNEATFAGDPVPKTMAKMAKNRPQRSFADQRIVFQETPDHRPLKEKAVATTGEGNPSVPTTNETVGSGPIVPPPTNYVYPGTPPPVVPPQSGSIFDSAPIR